MRGREGDGCTTTERAARKALKSEASQRGCPICGKPSVAAMQPFCSKRCADVDLSRWLGGVYAVPTDEAAEDSLPRRDDE